MIAKDQVLLGLLIWRKDLINTYNDEKTFENIGQYQGYTSKVEYLVEKT